MSDKILKYIVATVIFLLLMHQIGLLIFNIFGMVWGVLSALAVALVSFFTLRLAKAGAASSFWFLLPGIIFSVIPVIMAFHRLIDGENCIFDLIIQFTPLLIGFFLPIVLLLLIYFELGRREQRDNK